MKKKSLVNFALEETELILKRLIQKTNSTIENKSSPEDTTETKAYSKDLFDKFMFLQGDICYQHTLEITTEFDLILAVSNYTIQSTNYWIYAGVKDNKSVIPFVNRDSMKYYRKITANKLCLVTNKTFNDMVFMIKQKLPDKNPYEVLLEENRSYLIIGRERFFLLDSFKREPFEVRRWVDPRERSIQTFIYSNKTAKIYSEIFNKKIIVLGGSFLWDHFRSPQNIFLSICSDNLIEDLDSYLYIDPFVYGLGRDYKKIEVDKIDEWDYIHYRHISQTKKQKRIK